MIGSRDARALALFFAAAVASLAPGLFFGRSYFWGDLTYIHFPWKALVVEQLQNGRAPLWNPYNYMGMPLLGNYQTGALYPGGLPFALFTFTTGLKLYLLAHVALAGALAFLWLRRSGRSRLGSLLGATAWSLGGVTFAHLPFLNHLGSLCWFPALLLLAESPPALAAATGLCLLDGYPTFAAAEAAAALALTLASKPRREWVATAGRFVSGVALGAGLAAAMLLPSLELTALSERAIGLGTDVTLLYSFASADAVQFLGRLFLGRAFMPAAQWWKAAYWGLASIAALAIGLYRGGRRLWPLGVYVAVVAGLVLGGSNPLSAWVWTHAPPLRFIRYPGNLLFLLLPPLAYVTALGGTGRRARALWALAAAELVWSAWGAQPVVPDEYYREPGPLVRRLASEPGRYLLSPRALEWHRGYGPGFAEAAADLKHRLYGLTNAPYHLSAVGNFGEPLVPRPSYDWMDYLYRLPGLDATAPYLPLSGAALVLTRERLPSEALNYEGSTLWHVYRSVGPSGFAWWAPSRLPSALGAPPPRVLQPLAFARPREDGFRVRGEAGPGAVLVSQPLYPGWRGWSRGRPLDLSPAYGAFIQLDHPGGEVDAAFRYAPASWLAGVMLSLAAALFLGLYCYNRVLG